MKNFVFKWYRKLPVVKGMIQKRLQDTYTEMEHSINKTCSKVPYMMKLPNKSMNHVSNSMYFLDVFRFIDLNFRMKLLIWPTSIEIWAILNGREVDVLEQYTMAVKKLRNLQQR